MEGLETTNEERPCADDEPRTTNDELHCITGGLDQANAFLGPIVTSLRTGVVVLDRDVLVRIWNRQAADLWRLRDDEAPGQHFLTLGIGLPAKQMRRPIRDCLAGEMDSREISGPATNRRGRAIACQVGCMPLHGAEGEIMGVILLMGEDGNARAA